MMADRYMDFDAFFAEMKREPVRFKFKGEEFTLPPSVPAGVVFEVINLQRNNVELVPNELVVKMAELIFGEDMVKRLIDLRVDMDQLELMVNKAIDMYTNIQREEWGKRLGTPQETTKEVS